MTEQVETAKAQTTESKICLICHKAVNASLLKCPDDGGDLVNTKQDRLVGQVFANRYRIQSIIGQGGMSTVYKAQHTYMDRVVAVKLLHPHLVSDPISVQRFQQEAKAAASLSHPNIITVFDFGVTEDGLAFLVMDYLEGPSLGDLLDRTGSVPADEAIDIFRQVLKGLAHAHRKGVVHRDLKPRNMVLAVDEDGTVQVKIVDFGIAKVIPQDGGESQHLTQTGEVFGSPIYMSPEQCSGLPLDLRSDIYSWGCVMYEVLTGVPPFLGKNAVETMSMHVNDPPPDFRQMAPNVVIPEELSSVVFGCLEKQQKKRYQTANAVLEALPSIGNYQPRATQTGTVAMKLSDMVQSTTSASGPAQGRSKTPRRTKKQTIRISTKTLATVFGVTLAFMIGLVAFFPFQTAEDPGSPLQKMIWQFEIWLADYCVVHQWPGMALSVLDKAVIDAKNLSGKNKRPNYEAMIVTLGRQADVLLATGDAAKQEDVIDEIVKLDRERWEGLANQILDDILEAQTYIKEIEQRGDSVQRHLSESRLNWAGSTRRIVEVARRLDATYAYGLEYELLVHSEDLLTKLFGRDFIGLADIKEQIADCLLNQDRVAEIGKRDLYGRIKEIRFTHDQEAHREATSDPKYIRAELHLGQWQRDRGEFDAAEKTLSEAIAHAEKCKEIGPDQLAEFYGSYGDLLKQINMVEKGEQLSKQASKLRDRVSEECTLNLKTHDFRTKH
ncbi:protein kinase [Candidatus Obscuribacterales bacterium]|nr:protein kinase [Candidatus Obscuribacterales bacterium]